MNNEKTAQVNEQLKKEIEKCNMISQNKVEWNNCIFTCPLVCRHEKA